MDQPNDNAEPILKFKELYNFNDIVNKHLITDLQSSEAEEVKSTVKIVGQDKNGSFLFDWTVNGTTYIAVHFPNSPVHNILYKFLEPTIIVSASVNEDTSLLAFTTVKENSGIPTFNTYIANIHSEAAPVPLKLDTMYYHKVLFLKSMGFDYRKLGTIHPEAKLLLIMHKVGIVFYQMHLRTIQNYTVISDEPKEESITEEIDWYQWDSINQWLYYGRFYNPEEKRGVTIVCIDFSQAYHIVLFCLQFSLPYDSLHYIGNTTYYNSPGAFVLPQKEINMQMLHVKDGPWCMCIQHSDGSQTDDGQYKIEYSVFMMHNGHVLKGYVNLDEKSEHGVPLHFMLLGQFVAVYAPGLLFHLLNVGAKSDPCHHLILGKEFTPSLPCNIANPRLSYVMSTSLIGEFDSTFIECDLNISYQCQLNQVAFLHLFKVHDQSKLSLIHLALVCLRQPELANSMISSLAQNPLSLDMPDILAEYIVSAAYASMQYECKLVVLKQLPLTTRNTFQGIIVKDRQNRTNARLQCIPVKKFVQQLQGQSEASFDLNHHEELMTYIPEGPFGFLYFNASLATSNIERMYLPSLLSSNVSGSLPQLDASSPSPPQQRSHVTSRSASESVIGRITATLTGRKRLSSSSSQPSNETLSFLTIDEELQESLARQKELLRFKCYDFYTKHLPLRSKTIIHNVAKSYTSNLLLQTQVVLDTIWKIVGFTLESNPVDQPIHSDSPARELLLYELIEGYFLALNQLKLPVPEGFHSFFVIMGYRCLDRLLFMQYLENGVLHITQRFVDALIADIDNGNDDIIMEIFSHLHPLVAQKALKKWDNAPFNLLRDRTTKPI